CTRPPLGRAVPGPLGGPAPLVDLRPRRRLARRGRDPGRIHHPRGRSRLSPGSGPRRARDRARRPIPSAPLAAATTRGDRRRPEEERPTDQEADPAEGGDIRHPPRRPEAERVEAPREEEDPDGEEPPRRLRARPRPPGRGPRGSEERQRVEELIARREF